MSCKHVTLARDLPGGPETAGLRLESASPFLEGPRQPGSGGSRLPPTWGARDGRAQVGVSFPPLSLGATGLVQLTHLKGQNPHRKHTQFMTHTEKSAPP